MVRVAWHVFVEANDDVKARKLIGQLGAALHAPVEAVFCERYWKDERLFDGRFEVVLDVDPADQAAVVFEVLAHAEPLRHRWEVNCPHRSADGIFEFSGIAPGGFRLSWLTWAMFQIVHRRQEEAGTNER